jgi:phenylalanyl-tRNA synthetase beta chain
LIDADKDVGARNARRLLVLYSDKKSGFEIVHGVLDRIMVVTGAAKGGDAGYEMVESDEATFFPGRQARIVKDGKDIGVFGIVHPDVLQRFDIVNPCSILELDLEPLLGAGGSE